MKKISDPPDKNRNTEPSSPARRTFVKGIAAMGAGIAVFPLLTNTAEAQVPAAPDNGIAPGSSRAEASFKPPGFPGRQDRLAWLRPLRLRDGYADLGDHAFQGAGRRTVRQYRKFG